MPAQIFKYRISSRGFGVGELKTAISAVKNAGSRVIRFESDLKIDADLLFYKVAAKNHEDALIGDLGTFSYHRYGHDNGKSLTVDAILDKGIFRFKLNENGLLRTVNVLRGDYDFTTMDCPETTMAHEGDNMTVRLLNLEYAKVVTRKFHWVKNEDVLVSGKLLRCRVVDFVDPDNSCRRWVSLTEQEGFIIVRQDGRGKSGTYSLKMQSIEDSAG